MTLDDLQVLVRDPVAFRKAFRKTDPDSVRGRKLNDAGEVISAGPRNELLGLLAGNFGLGRMPNIHQVVLPDGSHIRLKFHDAVKQILNSKGREVPGKESFLSYLEVIVAPTGMKAYSFSFDVEQVVWGTNRAKALVTHQRNIAKLVEQATELGIDLSTPTSWVTIYSEVY